MPSARRPSTATAGEPGAYVQHLSGTGILSATARLMTKAHAGRTCLYTTPAEPGSTILSPGSQVSGGVAATEKLRTRPMRRQRLQHSLEPASEAVFDARMTLAAEPVIFRPRLALQGDRLPLPTLSIGLLHPFNSDSDLVTLLEVFSRFEGDFLHLV